MDPNRFDAATRTLAHSLSRRGLSRGLAAVAAGVLPTSLIGRATVDAKKKKKKKKLSKTEKKRAWCEAFDYFWGCPTSPDNCCAQFVEAGIIAVCTECGCCIEGGSKCCLPGATEVTWLGIDSPYAPCCADDQSCCIAEGGKVSCCDPDSLCCGGKCCAPAFSAQCCGGTECCHRLDTCCPDGRCRLTC